MEGEVVVVVGALGRSLLALWSDGRAGRVRAGRVGAKRGHTRRSRCRCEPTAESMVPGRVLSFNPYSFIRYSSIHLFIHSFIH